MTPNLPALSDAEQVRALDIVRRDGRLAETGTDVDTGRGIIVEDVNCRSPQYGHRLVDLRFAPDTARCPTAYAIVDLSTEKLVRLGLLPHEIIS